MSLLEKGSSQKLPATAWKRLKPKRSPSGFLNFQATFKKGCIQKAQPKLKIKSCSENPGRGNNDKNYATMALNSVKEI
ncbi:hypothetical protein DRJ16_05100 [Candidatus Woesearchaeota archaeon]|nr:MAG: hypothetical protein DRJ16_05100 [Candidatus Woesearchaeota archaeon]